MKRGFTLLLAEDEESDVLFFKCALEEGSQRAGVPIRLALTHDGEEALVYCNS
jgi:hypothetical protein